jgi:hypothetical protein
VVAVEEPDIEEGDFDAAGPVNSYAVLARGLDSLFASSECSAWRRAWNHVLYLGM